MLNKRSIWSMIASAAIFLAAALVTLRAAEQASHAGTGEESATIADDPTIAPDAGQSADNNVSFPTDI